MLPSTGPAELRSSLDVVAVWMAVEDLDAEAINVRTEPGFSEPGLSAHVIPGAMPLYYFGTDTIIEVESQRWDGDEMVNTVIAQIPLSDVTGKAGIEVTGSVQNGDVEIRVLSADEMTQRLASTGEVDLETLRQRYLSF